MSQPDCPEGDAGAAAGSDAVRGLSARNLASSAEAYFARFAWDATVDPDVLAAEAYLSAVFGPPGAPGGQEGR